MNDGQIPTMSKQVRMIKLMQEVFSTNTKSRRKSINRALAGVLCLFLLYLGIMWFRGYGRVGPGEAPVSRRPLIAHLPGSSSYLAFGHLSPTVYLSITTLGLRFCHIWDGGLWGRLKAT